MAIHERILDRFPTSDGVPRARGRRRVVMAQALLWAGFAVASFAGAAAFVFAVVRSTDDRARPRRADRRDAERRGAPLRGEPPWWPEFEQAFSDYVRAGDGRRS
jgi:hypothetical protein